MKKQLLSPFVILFKLTNLWGNLFFIMLRKSNGILYFSKINISLIFAPSFLTFMPFG